jgi:membrane fusion protein
MEEQQSKKSLFREEVLNRKNVSILGNVIMIAPLSFRFWSFSLFGIAISLCIFLYYGQYAKRQEVHGILVPNKGQVNIYANKPGYITDKFVEQGDTVKKGQLLYNISTHQNYGIEEMPHMEQIALLEKKIEMQKSKIYLASKNIARHKKLLDKRLISEPDYQTRYENYLSTKQSLHDLEYRLSEVVADGKYTIKAPCDGTVSVLTAYISNQIPENSLLASIIPQESKLEGMLYVSSDAIGFIHEGQKVLLKYQAYPYQQFGIYESTVEMVDKSILSSNDIKIHLHLDQPFYRVKVALKEQKVTAYGKPRPLIAGMIFEGIIYGEKRKIWQWILDPIYSIKGNLI